MNLREPLLVLCFAAMLSACASRPYPMRAPTEAEARACEARGGTIEPAHALDEYVCLLPAPAP